MHNDGVRDAMQGLTGGRYFVEDPDQNYANGYQQGYNDGYEKQINSL